jgi:hypothetical protein
MIEIPTPHCAYDAKRFGSKPLPGTTECLSTTLVT